MAELVLGSRVETLSCALPTLPRAASEKGNLSRRPQLGGLHNSQEQFFLDCFLSMIQACGGMGGGGGS